MTEAALAYIINDILLVLDRQQAVLVAFCDVPAVFDAADHQVRRTRLALRASLGRTVLDWARLYLLN